MNQRVALLRDQRKKEGKNQIFHPLNKKNESTDSWVDYWKICVKSASSYWRNIVWMYISKSKKEKQLRVKCQQYWILVGSSPISCDLSLNNFNSCQGGQKCRRKNHPRRSSRGEGYYDKKKN